MTTKTTHQNSYDAMPYESNPFPQTSPTHLRTLAALFGLDAPKLENARVLELGCSSGGNIESFAYMYPDSDCVGIDLSKVQIDIGNEFLKKAEIKNLELKHMSIDDVDESLGKFDYIICHGVFSWVPEHVREKILSISRNNLTDNGVVYISYNTLPGWNMVRTVRDMMVYHSRLFENDIDKVSQGRLLLNFLIEATENNATPYAQMLRDEAKILVNQPNHYIRHEHLEDNNHQFYFADFMDKAQQHKLQYLSEASLVQMYLGNFPEKVSKKLAEIKDIVTMEQYLDYVSNRRFRSTLLCKSEIQLNRNLKLEDVQKFYISSNLSPEKKLSEIDLNSTTEVVKFFKPEDNNVFITTSSPAMKAIFYSLADNYFAPVSFNDLIELASQKLDNKDISAARVEFINHALKLVLSGHINISLEKPTYSTNFEVAKLTVSKLARSQAALTTHNWVTNLKQEKKLISELDKFAIRFFDGEHTIAQVQQKVQEAIQKGLLSVMKNNKKVESDLEILPELNELFNQYPKRLRDLALLEEEDVASKLYKDGSKKVANEASAPAKRRA